MLLFRYISTYQHRVMLTMLMNQVPTTLDTAAVCTYMVYTGTNQTLVPTPHSLYHAATLLTAGVLGTHPYTVLRCNSITQV